MNPTMQTVFCSILLSAAERKRDDEKNSNLAFDAGFAADPVLLREEEQRNHMAGAV